MNEINYEHFDYETVYKEVRESIKKPNILVCGGTGVGKSSIIRDIFDFLPGEGPSIGNEGRPETRGILEYSSENSTVNLFDSEGYELNDAERGDFFRNEIVSFIDKRRKESNELENHIHEVWYCISAAGERFFDWDKAMIDEIRKQNIPMMIIITQVDRTDEESLAVIKDAITTKCPGITQFTYSTGITPDMGDLYTTYVQKAEILNWAMQNIDVSLANGLISAVKGSIGEKRAHILRTVVPKYTSLAAATVAATTFVPVPFTDSAALTAMQVKMGMEIAQVYGIDKTVGALVKDMLSSTAVSAAGRSIAAKLIGCIPYVGKAVELTVNTGVATAITGIIGASMTVLYEQYLKNCVDNNGKAKIPIQDFFTADQIKAAMNYVMKNKKEFNIGDDDLSGKSDN